MEPKKVLKAEDILARLRAGTKETYEIKCRELVVPVRILTLDELAQARREGIKQAALVGGDETDRNVYMEKTVLKLSSTLEKGTGPFLSDRLLSMLSIDEINFLYAEYTKVMEDVNPSVETIPLEQFRALVEAIKKNSVSSRDCSLHQLKAIFTAFQDLIQRVDKASSRQANSSGGQS